MENTYRSNEYVPLTGRLEEFRQALQEEIAEIKKSGQSSTLLYNGRKANSPGPEFWYKFSIEYAPTMPADTPCKLKIENEQFDVTVVGVGDNEIIIASKNQLPDSIGKATLENGSTVLMERLISRIEEKCAVPNLAGDRMFITADLSIDSTFNQINYIPEIPDSENLNDGQRRALISAVSNDITYIWGPPGTGKTTVIGKIIDYLRKDNRSVLVVSHTNTAVDGAIDKAISSYKKIDEWKAGEASPILRVGTPVKQLPKQATVDYHISVLGKELFDKKAKLEKELVACRKELRKLLPIINKCLWCQQSKISELSMDLAAIAQYDKTIQDIINRRKRLQDELSAINMNTQELIKFEGLKKTIHRLELDLCEIKKYIDKLKYERAQLPPKIETAKNEIAVWLQYADLKSKSELLFSQSYISNNVSKLLLKVASLEREKEQLEADFEKHQKTINNYNTKSSIVKFFYDKSNIVWTEDQCTQILQKIAAIEADITANQRIKADYDRQWQELKYIENALSALHPKESLPYWRNEAETLQNRAVKLPLELEEKELACSELTVRLDALTKEFLAMLSVMKSIKNLESEIAESDAEYTKVSSLRTDRIRETRQKLDKELSLCAPFCDIDADSTISDTVTKLRALMAKVENELVGVDSNRIFEHKNALDQQIQEHNSEIESLKGEMQELEKQSINTAMVVGATLAKSYLSDILQARMFDTVILDEASMASIPALWCAAYLAERNIIVVGDFLQLPPIVIAETPMAKKWLGTDVFMHSGMQERAKKHKRGHHSKTPANFVMLNEQFRMEKDIADIANIYYSEYSKLISAKSSNREKARDKFFEWYCGDNSTLFGDRFRKESVALVDTENLHAWVTGIPQGKKHSRMNCFSAAVDVELAFYLIRNKLEEIKHDSSKCPKEPLVLIVCPFKPQVSRINKLIDLAYKAEGFDSDLGLVKANSVHGFQGSEADIVIFDLVIDEPHWKAGMFIKWSAEGKIDGKEVNEGYERLYNVAITRARYKLFVVGNFSFCQKRSKGSALEDLLTKFDEMHFRKIDAKKLLPHLAFSAPDTIGNSMDMEQDILLCGEGTFLSAFIQDVRNMHSRMTVYSPFITESRLSSLLPYFTDKINSGCMITVVTKSLPERSKGEAGSYKKCEEELQKIGVRVIHKKGMHEKTIIIDDDIVWNGSLNALSFTGNTGEIMQRCKSRSNAQDFEKFFFVQHINEVASTDDEQTCPVCGGELNLCDSDSGGVYWRCINEDYTRDVKQQYPRDGLFRCPKCGVPYEFSMINEPRWVCPNNSKHFQKMRRADLQLEKMAALIPTKKARQQVEKYFDEHTKGKVKTTSKKKPSAKKKTTSQKNTSTKKNSSIDTKQL